LATYPRSPTDGLDNDQPQVLTGLWSLKGRIVFVTNGERFDHRKANRSGALFLVAVASFLLAGAPSFAQEQPLRALILHAYNYTFPATTLASEGARKRLLDRSPKRLEIEAEFLDLARLPGDANALRMATFLRDKYQGKRFDLVLSVGIAGVPFLIKYRELFAPNVPVVFMGGTREHLATLQLPPDITGVLAGVDPDKVLELAERLQPHARHLMVICGNGELGVPWQRWAHEAINRRRTKLEVTTRFDFEYDALLEEISHLPRDTIILFVTAYADKLGRSFIPADFATAVAGAASVPVYSPFVTHLGTGIVGGYTETYESLGEAAADMALEILSGSDPAKLPPRMNPGQTFRVDARAMDRWGLKRSALPPGTVILFDEPGIWKQHRLLISATAAIVTLQSVLLTALLFQRHRRRKAERSLTVSEDRMTFIATSMNVGLWQFNRATDELWATEHTRAMFGIANDAPLTRETFLTAVHHDDRRLAFSALRGALKGQPSTTDIRVVPADGQVRWIRVRARSLLDETGAPDQLTGVFFDITAQKAAESEAELHREEVAHLTRVSVLGELSGAIAHEVNQPLTSILSNAQAALYLLTKDSPNLAEVRDALHDIVSEDKRAGDVVHRLRGLLKKGEARSELVDVNEVVDSATALLRGELINRRVTVETDLAASRPTFFGDSVQLQQVLLNLVINAMDAMASTPETQRRVRIRTQETNAGTVEILVKDNGTGIKQTDRKQLFVPFYTTKDRGLGLGLTICSAIVRKHGGTINLRNDETGGAVVEISLPAHAMMMAAQ
jgi:signal transduction histidine kinase